LLLDAAATTTMTIVLR